MSNENLSDTELCRLCLSDDSVSYPIFDKGSSKLADTILECTSIKIEPIEGVPSSICEVCKSKLVICTQFVKQCHKTEIQVRKIYKRFFELQSSAQETTYEEVEILDCLPGQDETLTEIVQTDQSDHKAICAEEIEIIDCMPEDLNGIERSDSQVIYLEIIQESNEDPVVTLEETGCIEPDNSEIRTENVELRNDVTETADESVLDLPTQPLPADNSTNPATDAENKFGTESVVPEKQSSTDKPSEKTKQKSIIIHKDGVKKYKKPCPVCGVLQQNLKQHMNVHSGAKKHICPYCNKAFSQRGNLTCHLNIHTGKKPHKCDQCDEAFGDPTALKMHKIKHSDEPTFKCDLCNTTLKYRHSLQTHMRSHRNDRRHVCTYCKMAFITSSSLKKHIRTHTGDRPFKCDSCQRAFICAGHLTEHKTRSHSNQRDAGSENETSLPKRGKRKLSKEVVPSDGGGSGSATTKEESKTRIRTRRGKSKLAKGEIETNGDIKLAEQTEK